jgi:hypothetical protein
MALQPFVGSWPLFQFIDLFKQSVGLLGRGISPSQGSYLHTGQHKQNKRTQTSMPQVGFEPMIPAFEQAKTVHALDRAATVIDSLCYQYPQHEPTNPKPVLPIVTPPSPHFCNCHKSLPVDAFEEFLLAEFPVHSLSLSPLPSDKAITLSKMRGSRSTYAETRNVFSIMTILGIYGKILSRLLVTIDGVRLEIGFTDHFNTSLVTTLNYCVIADLHTLEITTAYTKSFRSAVSSPVVPW